ncbi:MAG: hypothetical protein REI09_05180 [Candidatus Dactylopiibacterium sp.]|nr:hypothetical protein [Candidatus Dactylopiibacterium sp.]
MSQGIRLRDLANRVIFDSTWRCTRVIETFDTGASNGSRSYALGAGEELFYMALPVQATNESLVAEYPRISVSGGVVSWAFVGGVPFATHKTSMRLVVGVVA